MQIAPLTFIAVEPPELDAATPGVATWQDVAGRDVAFGATFGAWHWLRVMGAGSYRFPVALAGRVSAGAAAAATSAATGPTAGRGLDLSVGAEVVPQPGVDPALVTDSYYRTVVPLALQAYGFEMLHGSAVALGGGVVALCAEPETGKSTLAFALQRRGAQAVADDAVIVSAAGGRDGASLVHPLPFALRLREASAAHFGSPSKAEVRVGPESAGVDAAGPLPLAAVVMLARHDAPVALTRLAAAEAFPALLGQSYAFTLADAARKRAMMDNFLGLARAVPVFRLAFPSGLQHVPEICSRLEGLAAGAGALPRTAHDS